MYRFLQKAIVPPVYVFQMGKVGSSSLKETLSNSYDGIVIHAHNYQMMGENQKKILRWRKRLRLPIYVICPIREPLSRNISAFFQNFKRDTGHEFTDRHWTVDELVEMFMEHYPHNVCLEWFDKNLRTTFGVDVFSEPFPTDQKSKRYIHKAVRIPIYRSDLDRSKQLEAISGFLGHRIPQWTYQNVSQDKAYGAMYRKFLDLAKLPEIYVSIMCDSRFCRQFWTEAEIDAIRLRWEAQ